MYNDLIHFSVEMKTCDRMASVLHISLSVSLSKLFQNRKSLERVNHPEEWEVKPLA